MLASSCKRGIKTDRCPTSLNCSMSEDWFPFVRKFTPQNTQIRAEKIPILRKCKSKAKIFIIQSIASSVGNFICGCLISKSGGNFVPFLLSCPSTFRTHEAAVRCQKGFEEKKRSSCGEYLIQWLSSSAASAAAALASDSWALEQGEQREQLLPQLLARESRP